MRRLNNAVIAQQHVGGWHGQQENGAQAANDSLVQLKLSAAIYYRARPILGVGVARWGKKLKETPALTAVDFPSPHRTHVLKFASAHLDKIEKKRTVFPAQKEPGVGQKSLKPEPTVVFVSLYTSMGKWVNLVS
jgi:hypothetical protein